MNTPIISREFIRERARAAFAAGHSRDDHNMNWHAPALATWLAEYDRLAGTPPRSHAAPAGLQRIEQEHTLPTNHPMETA